MFPTGIALTDGGHKFQQSQSTVALSADYKEAFYTWLRSEGKQISAALYEGAGSAGGFVVPVMVDGQIVPLAPQESAVRNLATVIPTSMDIKIPQKASFGAVAIKSESGASTNLFTESDPTLSQITLFDTKRQ
jgi:HK97 family phage major capsid protein